MSKIYRLFIDENIKTWKKFSTKLLLIFIILALVGALGLVKIVEKLSGSSVVLTVDSSMQENIRLNIESLQEELKNEELSEEERQNIENQIKVLELKLKYNINNASSDWKNTLLNQLSTNFEEYDKIISLIENDDFYGWIQNEKESLKKQLEDAEITQDEYDNQILLLELREKYKIGIINEETGRYDWRENVLSDIRNYQSCLNQLKDNRGDVLTVEEKEEYENIIKMDIYRIENNIAPSSNIGEVNYRTTFETLAIAFVVAVIALFAFIVASGAISSEVSTGSIKFWALTPNKRWKILTAKILSLLFYIVIITLIMSLLTIACANIFFDTQGNQYLYVKDGIVKLIGNTFFIIEYYFAKIIPVIIFAIFALMLSVITRNTSVSLALSVGIYMGNSIAMMIINTYIKKDWMRLIPFNNLNIADKIFTNFENPINILPISEMASSTSLGFSLTVLGVCAILMFVTMYDSFNKRDII